MASVNIIIPHWLNDSIIVARKHIRQNVPIMLRGIATKEARAFQVKHDARKIKKDNNGGH